MHARDAGHHGELDGGAVVPAGPGSQLRGIVGSAVLAPEIQLVACRSQRTELGKRDRQDRRRSICWLLALPRGIGRGIESRQKWGASDLRLSIRLTHAGDRGSEIIVGVLGLRDQIIQLSRTEPTPPVRRGPRGRRAYLCCRRGIRRPLGCAVRGTLGGGFGRSFRSIGTPSCRWRDLGTLVFRAEAAGGHQRRNRKQQHDAPE